MLEVALRERRPSRDVALKKVATKTVTTSPAALPPPPRTRADDFADLIRIISDQAGPGGVWERPRLKAIRDGAPDASQLKSNPHNVLGLLERTGRIKVFWGTQIYAIVLVDKAPPGAVEFLESRRRRHAETHPRNGKSRRGPKAA